jgi:integrase
MPKALLLRRPSGLFVRFKLPTDIRARVGALFVVRSLRGEVGDAARLTAARLGYALGEAIERVRRGAPDVDAKKLIESAVAAAADGRTRDYTIDIPGVVSLRAESADDHARAMEALAALGASLVGRAQAAPPPPAGPKLRASAAQFLEHCRSVKKAPATLLETEHTLNLFCDLTDDVPMATLGVVHIDAYRSALAAWPVRARVMPAYKGLSARQIVAKSRKEGGGGVSIRTMEKHLDRLRTFFNWSVQRREMPHNPLTGLRLQSTAAKYTPTRRGFRPEELATLFEPDRHATSCAHDPHYFWIPTVALFTGARLGEIAQLTATDLDQVGDVWGVHITSEGSRSLKNRQSRRFIPLPERLLSLGFLDYARETKDQGFTDLFPGGSATAKNGPGDRVSKWFNRTYLRKACRLMDPEVCFHSFRHTFLSAADRLGLTENQSGALTGHAARSVQARHYIDAATVPERKERIDRIAASFTMPPLRPFEQGQFAAYAAQLRTKQARAEVLAARAARQVKTSRKRKAGKAAE